MRERLRSCSLSVPLSHRWKGLESNSFENPVVISSDSDSGSDEASLLLGTSSRKSLKSETSSNGSERVECDNDGGTGRRGRKRRSRGDDNERDGGEKRKAKEEPLDWKVEIAGRVLRSRSVTMRGGEKEKSARVNFSESENRGSNLSDDGRVEMRKDESNGSVGGVLKKLKGKRGRPVKPKGMVEKDKKVAGFKKGERGLNLADNESIANNFHLEKEVLIGKELNLKSEFSLVEENKFTDLETEGVDAFSQKKKGLYKQGKVKGNKTEKQLLRKQIMGMLLSAGWTIEYRPRRSREYNDAVYLSPEGKTHWSITLAYRAFKMQFEDGDGDCRDSKIVSFFNPIPEEVINKLTRVPRKRKEREMDLKQKEEGGSNVDKVIEKKSAKKKHGAENIGCLRHQGKLNSIIGLGGKSSKGRKKKCSFHEQDDLTGTSHGGMLMLVQNHKSQETQNRKQCALLVRSSEEGVNKDIDGYIPYSGKRSVLTWMIDLGTVPLNGKVWLMNWRKTLIMLEGRITRDGIHCGCCNEILTISRFETHAGRKLCQPFQNIFLENGTSILQCLLDSWNKKEAAECKGYHFIDVDGDDPNDDICGICGDGGDLICCDSCPSTFHQSCLDIQNFPSGDWHCVYCLCKFCGIVRWSNYQGDDNHGGTTVSALLTCCLCEERYHQSCILAKDAAINDDSSCPSFCGKKCQELFERLQMLLGVKHELEDGFSWTLIQRSEVVSDISLSGMPQRVECNSKLAVAWAVMDECFLPIVDHKSGINLIHNVLFNCGSNFNRLNFCGFFTAILERGDEIVSAASIRIHGNQLAEMPFIGTRHIYRCQGMCRRLLSAIETTLCCLNVEKLVIPAISTFRQTWTSVFGFKPLEVSNKQAMKNKNILVFPGIDMLQKPLSRHQFAGENMLPSADLKSTELSEGHQTAHEVANNSDMRFSAGPEFNISGESGLLLLNGFLNDTSDITSARVDFPEYATETKCVVRLEVTHDNLEGANKPVMNSQSSSVALLCGPGGFLR